MIGGLALFAIGAARTPGGPTRSLRSALWMAPWFAGHIGLGALGRYGGGYEVFPDWIDLVAVIAFSLAIFYLALGLTLTAEASAAAVARDAHQLEFHAP